MNNKKLIVFDFETDDRNPLTCNPVQLAAIVICPRKLEFINDATFESGIKPPDIEQDDYFENHKSTIEWHAKIQKCSSEDIINKWKSYPAEKDVWETFVSWLKKYHTKQERQTIYTAPIACGYNIVDFDLHIIKRLATKYGYIQKDGTPKIFNPRDNIDMLTQMFWWFENQNEPTSYSMDIVRQYFDIPDTYAHDALGDVRDTAKLMIRFLKTQRWVTNNLLQKGKLKGSFHGQNTSI